jgi:hypothetical protein
MDLTPDAINSLNVANLPYVLEIRSDSIFGDSNMTSYRAHESETCSCHSWTKHGQPDTAHRYAQLEDAGGVWAPICMPWRLVSSPCADKSSSPAVSAQCNLISDVDRPMVFLGPNMPISPHLPSHPSAGPHPPRDEQQTPLVAPWSTSSPPRRND